MLKSWAVPKGPSLDPGDNRLAMRTEDHPLDYGDFEGTIPKGEYGGGTVMLWDQGRWIPEPGKDPRKTIEEGHLHFTLDGERMKGEWVMFRLKPKPGEKAEPWMLKKVTDEFAEPDDGDALVDNCVTSVTTGRTMAEIAARRATSGAPTAAARRAAAPSSKASTAPPQFQEPQLATLVDAVPTGTGWLHEYKYDGYRLLLATGGGAATAWTRNGNDWSDKFRALVKAAAELPAGCLIDGEAVALGKNGKPELPAAPGDAQGRQGRPRLLRLRPARRSRRGHHASCPISSARSGSPRCSRRAAADPLRRPCHRQGRGAVRRRSARKAARASSPRRRARPIAARRSRNWLKVKCIQRQEFVIVGWQESDKRRGFRSLLLAARDGGKLTYAGKVGTGFNTQDDRGADASA